MENKIKTKVISGFIWQFAESCGAQIVSFIVSIILARILEPSDYGTISLLLVFITILNVFVDSGLGNALIQKKDADDADFSTVFIFNIFMCIVLYIIMFLCAPGIAVFYGDKSLVALIRVLSIIILISGVKNVQKAYVSKHMYFKKFFFATLGGTIFSAVVGIVLAYCGFGVWALVAQQLSNMLIDTIVLWYTVRWRPKWIFSRSRLKPLLLYGWKLLLAKLLDTVYNNLTQLIIGKQFSTADLAYYNRGQQFPNLIVSNVNSSIDGVLFPVMSKEQEDVDKLRRMTKRAITVSSFIMWPMMVGLAVIAEPMVKLILTDKWLECVPFLQIFCLSYALYPIHTANLNAIKALGRSDIFLKLEFIKKAVGITIIVVGISFGVYGLAVATLVASIIGTFINSYPNKKELQYSYLQQVGDILPSIIMSLIMGLIVYPIQFLNVSIVWIVLLQVTAGILVYIFEAKLIKNETYDYIISIVKEKKGQMKNHG